MDFFVYSRDAPGSAALRDDEGLLERHWSYMDGFAESMIARGPTLDSRRERATGSLHVLGLPSVDDAYEFVEREPNNRAGVYAEHSIWRFENLLGRTMWEFADVPDEPKFLIIARGQAPTVPAPLRERLIVYGALLTLHGAESTGVALAVQAPGKGAVESLVDTDNEIHDWEFGGRR